MKNFDNFIVERLSLNKDTKPDYNKRFNDPNIIFVYMNQYNGDDDYQTFFIKNEEEVLQNFVKWQFEETLNRKKYDEEVNKIVKIFRENLPTLDDFINDIKQNIIKNKDHFLEPDDFLHDFDPYDYFGDEDDDY